MNSFFSSQSAQRILIVEDDHSIRNAIAISLKREHYEPVAVTSATGALDAINAAHPALILLDVMLPDRSGFDLCRELRGRGVAIPIVFLSARSEEIDRVIGFEVGGDDYVTKPFLARELVARVQAHLRREQRVAAQRQQGLRTFSFGSVEVDFGKLSVTRDTERVSLTTTEFNLLRLLIPRRGDTVTREDMLREIWGYQNTPTTRTIDTHIASLRKKVEEDPSTPQHIISVHGYGYRFIV